MADPDFQFDVFSKTHLGTRYNYNRSPNRAPDLTTNLAHLSVPQFGQQYGGKSRRLSRTPPSGKASPEINKARHELWGAPTLKPTKRNDWVLSNCPNSLRLLIAFFRLYGFSFSGIVCKSRPRKVYDNELEEKSSLREMLPEVKKQAKLSYRLQRYASIAFNIWVIIIYIWMLIFHHMTMFQPKSAKKPPQPVESNITDLSLPLESGFQMEDIITEMKEDLSELDQLKTILRCIIVSLVYVYRIDCLVMFLYSLVCGGSLVRRLCAIGELHRFDRCNNFAWRILSLMALVILGTNLSGLLLFNGGNLKQWFFELDGPTEVAWMLANALVQLVHFVYLSITPIFFTYWMFGFRFAIEEMRAAVAHETIDEMVLLKLKNKLRELSQQFKAIIPHLAVPLSVSFVSNILIIISSSCFMMINQSSSTEGFISFAFSIGLFALIRLVVMACVGNLATDVCQELIRTVYENLDQWTMSEWMCFLELKRLKKEFTVSVFSMYTVRQSTIMTTLGFALNYIVVLLQTENFGSTTGADGNSTNSTNSTFTSVTFSSNLTNT